MYLRTLVFALTVLFCNMTSAQTAMNDYKYLIVPKKFDVFKKDNQYQTSTLVKYLLTQRGFDVVYEDALPAELLSNRCLGLLTDLVEDSSMFTTKTSLRFMDCNGLEVYVTQQGRSKSKEYKEAYVESIKDAMGSFNGFVYKYAGGNSFGEKPVTLSFKNDVKSLKDKEIAERMEPKGINTDKVKYKAPKNLNPTVIQEATTENQSYKSMEPVVAQEGIISSNAMELGNSLLYAQKTANGYQLVDSTPKIRMQLLKSSSKDMFMAQADGKAGMVYEKDGQWIFEYYEGENLIQQPLNIKF